MPGVSGQTGIRNRNASRRLPVGLGFARVRRGSIIQLTAIGLVAGAICTAVALAIPWLPVAGGQEAQQDPLRLLVHDGHLHLRVLGRHRGARLLGLEVPRAARTTTRTGRRPTGTRRSRSSGRRFPAVLVTAISIVSAIVLAQNGHAGTNPLVIKVEARQFAWKFTYPNGKSYGYLTLPQDRHVKLDITADDVIHSFWVPQLSQKQDAVPGSTNSTRDHADAHRHVPGDLHRALRPRPRAHAQPRRHRLRGRLREVGGSAAVPTSAGPPGLARLPAERLRRLSHVQAARSRPGPSAPTSTTWRRRRSRRTAARSRASSRSRSSSRRLHRAGLLRTRCRTSSARRSRRTS